MSRRLSVLVAVAIVAAAILLGLVLPNSPIARAGTRQSSQTSLTPDATALAILATQAQQLNAAYTADQNAKKVMKNAGGLASLTNAQTDIAGAQASNQAAVNALTSPGSEVWTTPAPVGCCGSEWAVKLNWALPPFPGTTEYLMTLNGTQVGTTTGSSYLFEASGCGVTVTLGVQPYDATSSMGGPVYTTPYVTPSCSASPFFDGTFSASSPPGSNWPSVYGSCYSVLSTTEAQFNLTSSCNPGSDGHYRTDLCSATNCGANGSVGDGDVYQANTATCTSIPVDFTSVPTVPTDSWLQFGETKDAAASFAGWGFYVTSFYGAVNEFAVQFAGYNGTAPAYHGTTGLPAGWNTFSICTNNANTTAGEVYGVYVNGVQVTFNAGSQSGSQTLSGFAIITDGSSSWPLDINDYTGGTPVPNTLVHGDPLVALGTNDPPEPAGGWNSP